MSSNPLNLKDTIRDIATRVRKNSDLATKLLDLQLAQIKKHNPDINALRIVSEKYARDSIKHGLAHDSLCGVTFCAKDHIDIAGLSRSEGNKVTEGTAQHTAHVIKLLQQRGAVCIGKSNMAEYGKSFFTDNRDFGRTSNPFNPKYTSGGSSGGDAAAVAAGFCNFGIGADSGGSIRIPASFCGLFGLYPTPGTYSSAGLTAFPHTTSALFRSIGIIARHLDDISILHSVLNEYDAADHTSSHTPPAITEIDSGKIVCIKELNGVRCHPEIEAQLDLYCKKFEKLGFSIQEESPAVFADTYAPFIILAGQASLLLGDIIAAQSGNPRDLSKESPSMVTLRKRIETELPPLDVNTLLMMWYQVDRLRIAVRNFFKDTAFVLAPVAACNVPEHGASELEAGSGKCQSQQAFQFSSMANALGVPALAFPVELDSNGLPIGLQLIGSPHSEKSLIAALNKIGCTTGLSSPLV